MGDGPTIGRYLTENPSCIPDPDAGMPSRALLLSYFAHQVWQRIWDVLDTDHSGNISLEELRQCDKNGDGQIDRAEMMACIHEIAGFTTHEDETAFVDVVLSEAGDFDANKELTLEEMNTQHTLVS